MSEKPTIEQYQKNIEDGQFRAYKCKGCSAVIAPPSGYCYACGGNDLEWTEVSGKGKLISFTVIHISADEFCDETPYLIGIVELEEGTRITARLLDFDPEKPEEVNLGIDMILDYLKGASGKTFLAFRPA